MADGLSAVNFANATLNVLRNVTFTGIATPFVQLHTGSPGAAGTSNVSGQTTRNAITWNAASAGSMTLATLSNWTMNTTETITDISIWSASTSGTFYWSAALTSGVPVINNSTLSFSSFTLGFTPIAA
jgi:hypothetical protein